MRATDPKLGRDAGLPAGANFRANCSVRAYDETAYFCITTVESASKCRCFSNNVRVRSRAVCALMAS